MGFINGKKTYMAAAMILVGGVCKLVMAKYNISIPEDTQIAAASVIASLLIWGIGGKLDKFIKAVSDLK